MFGRIRKTLKVMGLPSLGVVLALLFGILLMAPESFGAGSRNIVRPNRENAGRKKMNHGNHAVSVVNRYNIRRPTSGPTDVPRFRRPEYVIMNGETNVVIVTPEGEKETRQIPVVEKIKISRGEDGEAVIYKPRKQETGKPSAVHRVGRKGKERERQREALQTELENAGAFAEQGERKPLEKGESKKSLRKEGREGGALDASAASSNGFSNLEWQAAAPPTGGVHTASSPRRSGNVERREKGLGDKDPNGSARKIKERNRERQGESCVTNIARRAQYAGSADDSADHDD